MDKAGMNTISYLSVVYISINRISKDVFYVLNKLLSLLVCAQHFHENWYMMHWTLLGDHSKGGEHVVVVTNVPVSLKYC